MEAKVSFSCEHNTRTENQIVNNLKMTPGLWIDGQTYWLTNGTERLLTDKQLTIKTKQRHIHSFIDLFDIYICNHSNKGQNCKLIFSFQNKYKTKDHFTFISPVEGVVFHLANDVIYLVNGHYYGEKFNQATVQPLWNYKSNNIWSDLNRGVLQYHPMIKGPSVSIIAKDISLLPKETTVGTGWAIFGKSKTKLLKLNNLIAKSY